MDLPYFVRIYRLSWQSLTLNSVFYTLWRRHFLESHILKGMFSHLHVPSDNILFPYSSLVPMLIISLWMCCKSWHTPSGCRGVTDLSLNSWMLVQRSMVDSIEPLTIGSIHYQFGCDFLMSSIDFVLSSITKSVLWQLLSILHPNCRVVRDSLMTTNTDYSLWIKGLWFVKFSVN